MQSSAWPATSFTSAYVAETVRNDATWDKLSRGLRQGAPFVESGFAVMVKGKKQAVGIWSLTEREDNLSDPQSAKKNAAPVGYVEERTILAKAARDWLTGDSPLLTIVEGPSGVGKTCFLNSAINLLEPYGANISLCQGSTVDQGSPYFAVRGLLHRMITEMADPTPSLRNAFRSNSIRDSVRSKSVRKAVRSNSTSHASFRSLVASDVQDDVFTRKLWRVVCDCNIAPETASLLRYLEVPRDCPKTESLLQINFSRNDGRNPYNWSFYGRETGKRPADNEPNLQGIDESLIDSIMHLLGGNASPLILSTMVSSQREFILESSQIREAVLYMDDDAVKSLKLDVASGIQTQFDTLDGQSKMFFRYAASFGQYFDVALIVQVFDLQLALDGIESWIESHDVFSFLSVVETENGERSYFFRHISIMSCIYEGISFADRRGIHLRIARHLEEEIAKKGSTDSGVENEFLLPLVAYHYGRTGEFEKIIKNYDALSYDIN
ncbi:hypothetical protein HK101_010047 [Irineochytrium annulatum]|nr:hypothetical protein HK101_010047 [Irineochytrium annulatum]